MKNKRFIMSICLLIVVIGFILFWIVSILNCELLTNRHMDEFEDLNVIQEISQTGGKFKILSYTDTNASIFYKDFVGTDVLEFEKQVNKWKLVNVRYIWPNEEVMTDGMTIKEYGFVWPYIR